MGDIREWERRSIKEDDLVGSYISRDHDRDRFNRNDSDRLGPGLKIEGDPKLIRPVIGPIWIWRSWMSIVSMIGMEHEHKSK